MASLLLFKIDGHFIGSVLPIYWSFHKSYNDFEGFQLNYMWKEFIMPFYQRINYNVQIDVAQFDSYYANKW